MSITVKTLQKCCFIPASNEPSAVLARAFMTIELVLLYGECREGQNTNALKRIQLCCASSLIPRQLAAGYLIITPGELQFAKENAEKYKLFLVYNVDNEQPDCVELPTKFWEDVKFRKKEIVERIEFEFYKVHLTCEETRIIN